MKKDPELGRPRLVADPWRVNLTLEAAEYDRLDAEATQRGISVPELIRRRLRATFRAKYSPPSGSALA